AWAQNGGGAPQAASFGRAQIAFDAHEVTVDGARIELTRLELDLLRYFVTHAGRVLTRAELLENVWHLHGETNTRTVDTFVMRLRQQLEQDPRAPRHFHAVRGRGYKFTP
ncbi:MAG: winged helix-turn-helix transcriptional regulator, partial [Myxococcales bacterium]|nr:winged helix-turn-helix transcriptional regulator [Myxococcales bacterium]